MLVSPPRNILRDERVAPRKYDFLLALLGHRQLQLGQEGLAVRGVLVELAQVFLDVLDFALQARLLLEQRLLFLGQLLHARLLRVQVAPHLRQR